LQVNYLHLQMIQKNSSQCGKYSLSICHDETYLWSIPKMLLEIV